MMIRLCLFLVLCLQSVLPAQAALDIDVSEPNLEITTGFNGDTLTLFGTANPKGDIVILVKGPKKDTVIRRKTDIMGLWIQAESVIFENVPGYYNVASSQNIQSIADKKILDDLRLGIDSLTFQPEKEHSREKHTRFQEALIQNMQLKRLFSLTPDAVIYLNDTLFKTRISMPANVPLGDYTIEAFLFKDGVLIDRESKPFSIAQTGLTGEISAFSKHRPFLYGVTLVLIAFLSGIMASIILRRD